MTSSIVEATISDLQNALSNGSITAVELVAKYLLRIFIYDCRGPCLNAIPILNPNVFEEAAASDSRRRSGSPLGPLDGIPYTLKDSMKYKGMTCSAGSPAFKDFVADEDAFVAKQLRDAGAVCLGRTNTPPMMASGMHRGLHGRAESPYNLNYLTAAFSSGSSSGSGTSTAASFAAFGLGSETVSSGRSPASNNALVAYTPSRCVISPRGIWSLYPTCDVLVPHTRTVRDMLMILDFLVVPDNTTDENFWRQQKFVEIPEVSRPQSFLDLIADAKDSLRGKRIAIPKMYIGGHDPDAKPTVVSQDVIDLWSQARKDLEALGATVTETDFPLVTRYEDDSVSGHANNVVGFVPDWNSRERAELVAYPWDDFLKRGGDSNFSNGLAFVDGTQMFPRPDGYIPDRYMEIKNFMNYPSLVELARKRGGKTIWDVDGIAEALPALEAQRKRDFEDWMDQHGIDIVVLPLNGDVGKADLDTNDESAKHALQNGVRYSNGNRAFRHMGIPSASVCMGLMAKSSMPVGLTFTGKHGQDSELLKYAYAFEQHTRHRIAPPVTPALPTDNIDPDRPSKVERTQATSELRLKDMTATKGRANEVRLEGSIDAASLKDVKLEIFVDGGRVEDSNISWSGGHWSVDAVYTPFEPPRATYGGVGQVVGNVNIVILARSGELVVGKLIMIPQ